MLKEEFNIGDVVKMKKPHACQENSWKIIRVGADVKIKCMACNRIVMLEREVFVNSALKILEKI